jgi:viroplasmin and RNaseH domain-containing protein
VYHKAIENFSARRFATFKTREEALEYLTKDETSRQSA